MVNDTLESSLRRHTHDEYLKARSMDRLIGTVRFWDFYRASDKKTLIRNYIYLRNLFKVKQMMEEYYKDDQTWYQLRRTASSLHIVNYSRMGKAQLEKAIDKRRIEISNNQKS